MKFLKSFIYLNVLLISFFSISCKKKVIKNKAELFSYINDPVHGLKKNNKIGKIKVELLFKPWQLIAANEDKKSKADNDYQNKYFFVLRLSANNHELLRQLPFDQYSQMVQILAFRMMEFITIVPDKGKRIDPEDCLFQQTYGMSDANQLLIIFNKAQLEKASTLNFKLNEFGLNVGNLKFEINTSDIEKMPSIVFNK